MMTYFPKLGRVVTVFQLNTNRVHILQTTLRAHELKSTAAEPDLFLSFSHNLAVSVDKLNFFRQLLTFAQQMRIYSVYQQVCNGLKTTANF